MVDRINIVTLIILLFLSVGRAFVRAGTLMVVNSVMQNPVIKPDEWREVYRWVLADKNVPDRKEVLMLIRYHYGNFGKLTDLLCYLNEGRACKYLLQFVFPRIGSYTVHSKEFSIAGIRMPEKALPVVSAGSGELVPTAFPEKRKRLGPSHKVMVALKNNMIYDLALAPNVEVEFSIGKYNPQIQISAESETKRSIFREKDKTKRSKKESAQHSKSRNKSFVMTSVSAL